MSEVTIGKKVVKRFYIEISLFCQNKLFRSLESIDGEMVGVNSPSQLWDDAIEEDNRREKYCSIWPYCPEHFFVTQFPPDKDKIVNIHL